MNPGTNQIQAMVTHFFQHQQDLYGDEFIFSNLALKNQLWEKPGVGYLQKIKLQIENCTECVFSKTRKNAIFGAGHSEANFMLIAGVPEKQEDLKGMPFVGDTGQLLDKILNAIGFDRSDVYITHILKCRPSDNQDPKTYEIEQCLSHLKKQIQCISPKVILTLGSLAAQTLLNTTAPLNQLRKKEHVFQGIPLLATFHPAALLQNPQDKGSAWEDVQRFRKLYDQVVGDKGIWKPAKEK